MTSVSSYRDHWPLIIVLASLTMIDIMAIDLYLPAFPEVAHSLGASASSVQVTLSIFILGLAIGQLIYGPVFDRFGRRVPLLIGITLFAAGSWMAAIAPTIEVLWVARLIQATGAAGGVVAPRAIVTDLFIEQEAASVYSVLGQIQMIAPVAAPLIGALILQWSSWRTSFWVLLAITLLVWAAAYRIVPDSLPNARRTALSIRGVVKSYAALFRNRAFMFYCLAGTMLFGALFSYITLSPFVIMTEFGFTTIQFSLLFGFNALFNIATSAVNIKFLKSTTLRTLLLWGFAFEALMGLFLWLLAYFHADAWTYVPVLASYIGAFGFIFGNLMALTMAQAGPQAGSASALMGASQYAGGALTGLAASWSNSGSIVLASALFLCALAAFFFSAIAPLHGSTERTEVQGR